MSTPGQPDDGTTSTRQLTFDSSCDSYKKYWYAFCRGLRETQNGQVPTLLTLRSVSSRGVLARAKPWETASYRTTKTSWTCSRIAELSTWRPIVLAWCVSDANRPDGHTCISSLRSKWARRSFPQAPGHRMSLAAVKFCPSAVVTWYL